MSILDALPTFDRAALAPYRAAADRERADILTRFPLADWPALPLTRYALGQNHKDVYSYCVEFGANHLGSMRGGAASKHVIYKRRTGDWFFYDRHPDVDTAWAALRSAFVAAFSLAQQGKWSEIDLLQEVAWCPALLVKSLHIYFPDDVLPIASNAHLQHFLGLVGRPEASESAYDSVRYNRALLEALRTYPDFADFSTLELERFLYHASDPRDATRVLKIAPGDNARFWDDCRNNGYVCVGWDEVGDLRSFQDKPAFRAAFGAEFSKFYNDRQQMVSRKANELWRLSELEPGDVIIANRGTKEVLAVGTVVEPGYEFRSERNEYQHCVHVAWDESYRQSLDPPIAAWGTVTVAAVSASLYEQILARRVDAPGQPAPPAPHSVPVDITLTRLGEALERKGQAILYGPPGTGKTYSARRFAVWWLLKDRGDPNPTASLADPNLFKNAERSLATPEANDPDGVAVLTRVSFHASYSYEDFIEGFRPVDTGQGLVLRLEDGVFKRVCLAAKRNPKQRYLLLVDEINRANVAKVMGELLTLLERDKRGLTMTLPQSKQAFEIPPNVHLLGTMNTADRSITLLDAALRRRFAFLELMPDTTMLEGARVQNLELDTFLDALNARVMRSPGGGREKQIGHAYLLEGTTPIRDVNELARRFHQEILPLLQEYCFDDYRVLASYLGEKIVDVENQRLGRDAHDPSALLGHLEREFENDDAADEASE